MAARRTHDLKPGSMPAIRTDGNSVIFQFEIAGLRDAAQLVIRCDADGAVWASAPELNGIEKRNEPSAG
jgi:hypothetical protein